MRSWILVALAALFAALFLAILGEAFYVPGLVMLVLAIAFFLLGLALVILTVRAGETGRLRFFLILTGACAAATPVIAILHNFLFHGFFFVLALFVLPVIFLVALVASVILLAMAEKPVSAKRMLLVGLVLVLVLAPMVRMISILGGDEGYEVTSQLVGAPPDRLDRVFVTAEAHKALIGVVYHSFEHSLVSALESNGIAAQVRLMPEDSRGGVAPDAERAAFAPDATMHISLDPLYRTHKEGYEAVVGTVFEVSLSDAATGAPFWELSGKVDYVVRSFFDQPGFVTSNGMQQEFAWHTTAAIVRTLMVDVIGRESEPIYTITEERQRKGQRAD